MKRTTIVLLVVLGGCFFSQGSAALAFQTESELLAILSDDKATAYQESAAFQELAVVGTERSVTLLAKRLEDPESSHLARQALEPIPSPAVDTAFRKAIPKLGGQELIGLISSIGNRQDTKAIPDLVKLLSSQDPDIAKATANCLARLGTLASAQAFQEVSTADYAEPLLIYAKTLTEQGHVSEATKLFSRVGADSACSFQNRNAAKLELILLGASSGLSKALESNHPSVFNMGLRAARLVPAAEAAQAVLDLMPNVSKHRLPRLLTLLGDLGEAVGQYTVIEAVHSQQADMRVAAYGALLNLGTVEQVPLLLEGTNDREPRVAAQAEQSLVNLPAEGVDRALLELLKANGSRQATNLRQATVVRVIGKRKIATAVPQLLTIVDGPHQIEVIGALGETVSIDDLDSLGKFLKSDSSETRKAAGQAIHMACARMPDRAATVAFLTSYLDNAPEEIIAFVYDELRQISGAEALQAVAEAAAGDDLVRKDHATRALGKWVDTSAADVLLAIAKSEGGSKYGIRCLRGYIRLTRQFPSMHWSVRLKMCYEVLQVAVRKEEKVLIFESLLRYGYTGELKFSIEARENHPDIAQEAEACAIAIARKMGVKREDVRKLLTEAGIPIPAGNE